MRLSCCNSCAQQREVILQLWRRQLRELAVTHVGICRFPQHPDSKSAYMPTHPFSGIISTMSKPDIIGQVVAGRYEVARQLGRGGMGAVYLVKHKQLGRRFAMKTIKLDLVEDPEALERFHREAKLVSKLRHPNIVDIVGMEALDDGSPCIVMEYLRGEDLHRRLKREGKPLTWPVIAQIGDQVMRALSVAHEAGIVHRDLKPQNIFLAQDDAGHERAILLDFGVSKIRDSSQTLATTEARLLGTPSYMSPEQAEGRHTVVGPPADIWALGAIIFEMATSVRAFDGPNLPTILYRICHGEPESLVRHRPEAPPDLVSLIRRIFQKNPTLRIGSVEAVQALFRAALDPLAPRAFANPMRANTLVPEDTEDEEDGQPPSDGVITSDWRG